MMNIDRRDFLTQGAALGAAWTLGGTKPREKVRVGFVGVGHKGSAHVGNLLRMEAVELAAVCDVVEGQCVETQLQAERLGRRRPSIYARGERDFERMCAEEDLDLVYTATPWEWHVPVLLAAMRNGKHAATEVPAAVTLEDCWALVESSEKTGRHCVMMENVNYMRPELAALVMIRKGLLGEIVHAEAGYRHDTRHLKIKDTGDGLWLGTHHARRNGNLYPTHGLGPLAWYMDLNRGDRMEVLVSMSSRARGMDLFASEHLPEGHPKRTRKYVNGDVNTSLIRTAKGNTIVLTHDTDLPRPYSRTNLVQGTRGMLRGFPDFRVSLEKEPHSRRGWDLGRDFLKEFDHPLWRQGPALQGKVGDRSTWGPIGKGAVWHYHPESELKGGDFLEDYRLVEAIRTGAPPDFDVYDAASWSVVSALSEKSVAERSRAVDFPDFTRGRWKQAPPMRILGV